MKQFIAFVRKEFFHIFRDRRTMLILLGMPVVQIILFGFAITTEVKNVRVAVLDPSNDIVTRRIIDRLDASEYFSVTTNLNTPDEVEKSFRRGDIDLADVRFQRAIRESRLYRRCLCTVGGRCYRPQYGNHTNRLCRQHHILCRTRNASGRSAGFHYCSRSEAAL